MCSYKYTEKRIIIKRVATLILSLAMLLSLCACAQSGGNSSSNDATSGNGFNFHVSDPSMDFNITTYESVPVNTIGFTIAEFEYDFSIDPVEFNAGSFTFVFPDYDFTIDVDTFDVGKFTESAAENFPDDAAQKVAEMPVEEVVRIAESRANLLADLSYAFKSSGLDVTINEEIGEISLDSSVLFDVDKATISPEGKEFLKKFMAVYTTVVFNEKYDDFISSVMVEGHTDSSGDYNYNMTLSQARADSVMAYCLSKESGIGQEIITALEKSLEAVGYSCDKLIYDENGNEDKDASRRVSFRFLISLP